MMPAYGKNTSPYTIDTETSYTIHDTFPTDGRLETEDQMRRFELLRLAFFALKLRKLTASENTTGKRLDASEKELRRSLLCHAIFQQILTLTKLGAREQALQIIAACRK